MAHDVFISYSQKDKPFADSVCAGLEGAKIRCWVAPRDITGGMNYAESIIDAIRNCSVFVLIFSSEANTSNHVLREVERAVNNSKIIIPFRIQDCMPSKSMEYFISVPHWLDAYTEPLGEHINKLITVLKKLIDGITAQEQQDTAKSEEKSPITKADKPLQKEESYKQTPAALLQSDFLPWAIGILAMLLAVPLWYFRVPLDPYFLYYLISAIIGSAILHLIVKNSTGKTQRTSAYAFCLLIAALVTIAVIWRGIIVYFYTQNIGAIPEPMGFQHQAFYIPYFILLGGFAFIIFSSINKYTDTTADGNRKQIIIAIVGTILYLLICRVAWEIIDQQVLLKKATHTSGSEAVLGNISEKENPPFVSQ